ncbi:MAG TPA: ABC transporter ATP-binding protein [Acidimicrobiia bacterium]|nr:ABC transporter ATP-binding protein [Acidimicrobiia bacterium]
MLSIEHLGVTLEDKAILHDTTLTVDVEEIVAVLGPSGSGKTTLLRAIAGLVAVESGDVKWDEVSVVDVPVHQRGFGLMFQGFALFPHLDVAGNVGFGLRMAGTPPELVTSEVSAALDWVGLSGFESRGIDDLSGGERQRVALARTLAPRPKLVMLDEPLGSLDRHLRERLVLETRALLTGRKVTGLVVTHDREEATLLSDRLALMREGTIVQTGTLEGILANPVDDWVTEFLA